MIIFIIIVGTVTAYHLFHTLKDGTDLLKTSPFLRRLLMTKSEREHYRSLLSDFTYYAVLNEVDQEVFFQRTLTFLFSKNFLGKQGLLVTDDMRILVSACAAQLTFGLKSFRLNNLEDVIIYPSTFFLGRRAIEYKGAYFKHGVIALSWEDLKHGYRIKDDNYNLGIHEMTHALRLSLHTGSHLDLMFASYIDTWDEISTNEFVNMRRGTPSVLRSYGKTNRDEFFSVCVEHFFESPHQLKEKLPDLYYHLCVLLNQAPCNVDSGYKLDEEFYKEAEQRSLTEPLPKKIQPNYKYHSWHWSLSLLLIGIFSGIFLGLFLYHNTFLQGHYFFLFPFLIGTVSLFNWRSFKKYDALTPAQFALFSYGGVGINVFTILLLLNYFTAFFNIKGESYKIVGAETYYVKTRHGRSYPSSYTLFLENGAFSEYGGVRSFFVYQNYSGKNVYYKIGTGILGIQVVKEKYLY